MSAPRANALTGAQWLKNSFSIWRDIGKDRDAALHPAPFPVELAGRLIACYAADPLGLVLDPFAGSGSTMLAALRAGMPTVGFDINPAFHEIFKQRLGLFDKLGKGSQYIIQDSRKLADYLAPGSVEICITSPPYWDILNRRRSADGKTHRPYSNGTHDLGNMKDYREFLGALATVANQVGMVLRERGYFILNVMDIRKKSLFYPLNQDASHAVVSTGLFTLDDIIIWDRQADYNAMRPLGYPHKFIVNKVHEYLLIFRKSGE